MVAGQTGSEDMGSLLTPSVMALHPPGSMNQVPALAGVNAGMSALPGGR